MKKSHASDVPRPHDDSRACVSRLLAGEFHALVDLSEALEREDDPRSVLVNRLLEGSMKRIMASRDASVILAEWQRLTIACLRVMTSPHIEAGLVRAEKLMGRQELRQ